MGRKLAIPNCSVRPKFETHEENRTAKPNKNAQVDLFCFKIIINKKNINEKIIANTV